MICSLARERPGYLSSICEDGVVAEGYRGIRWNEIYATGAHRTNWDRKDPAPELVEFVRSREWVSGDRAVDLGCGTGSDAMFLASAGFETIGVDISAEAIAEASARGAAVGSPVTWLRADACDLPITEASQTLITDSACLHHFAKDQWNEYADEIERILRPTGTLVVRGVSRRHRDTNILREDWIDEVFGERRFRVDAITEIQLLGSDERTAPGLLAVIERTK